MEEKQMGISADELYDLLDDLGLEPTQRISTLITSVEDDEMAESEESEED
jgi:hypothetical protein